MKKILGALVASAMLASGAAKAAELEVVHWWTSGGEAAAVNEFAKAFDAAGHKWVDGAIAGGGGTNAIGVCIPPAGRRPDGRHTVQPWSSDRRPDQGRPVS